MKKRLLKFIRHLRDSDALYFWSNLEDNHPILYEVVQCGVLILASVSLVLNIIIRFS